MEPGRSLCRDRRSRGQARPRSRRRRQRRVRAGLQGQARRAGGRARRRAGARRGGEALRGARRSASAGIGSFAGLVHAGNTVDPARAKFYGDVQERITAASTHLLFFVLELNRLDDASSKPRWRDPALGHYRPWLEDIRKDKPYQLEDRIEQLFHEKSVTAYSAWNRLFDETIARLRFKVARQVAGDRADAQSAAGPEREDAQGGGAGAGRDLQGQPAAVRAHHQHARQGQGDFRPLARLRRRRGCRAISPTGSSPRWSMRWWRRCAPPIRGCRTATTRSRRSWFGKKRLPHWDRNAPLPKVATRTIGWNEAHATVLTAYGAFSPDMAAIAERFFERNWIDAPVRPGQGAGRLRASDRAVGASLRAAQLPGQAARRDDARARARPRRAPGAGGAERRADGADAADAGRDRERVRRDAHLPQAARQCRRRKSARPCSPPRSRT